MQYSGPDDDRDASPPFGSRPPARSRWIGSPLKE